MTEYYYREIAGYTGQPVECFKFSQTSPAGTTYWRNTSADASIVIADGTFTPAAISRGQINMRTEDESGGVDVHVELDNTVAQLFASVPPQWPVGLTIFRVHRGDLDKVVTVFVGHVATVTFANEEAIIHCAPISRRLSKTVPSITYQSQCAWDLYGTGCGVIAASFQIAGVLTAVSGADLTATEFGARPDGWFNNGFVTNAVGERRFIVAHVGTTITLSLPFLPQLSVGANVTAYAGCDRSESVCAAKFSNLVNHLGFPRIPLRNPHDTERHGSQGRTHVWTSIPRRTIGVG